MKNKCTVDTNVFLLETQQIYEELINSGHSFWQSKQVKEKDNKSKSF